MVEFLTPHLDDHPLTGVAKVLLMVSSQHGDQVTAHTLTSDNMTAVCYWWQHGSEAIVPLGPLIAEASFGQEFGQTCQETSRW